MTQASSILGGLAQLSSELENLVARTSPSVVGIGNGRGHGTGVVLTPDGYLLTNDHVARQMQGRPHVELSDGEELVAEIIGQDERTDLAVLRIPQRDLSPLPLADSRNLKVGQLVLAIGNPFGFDRSVSLGVISAVERTLPGRGTLFEGLIQTDAAINPGNSGGPLCNVAGEVVGINTAAIPYAQGIGFAVPAHTASWVAAVLIQKGAIHRPFLGIAARGEELGRRASQLARRPRAVRVFHVDAATPASDAGLEKGDLLLEANGTPLGNVDDLQRAMVLGESPLLELGLLRGEKHERATVRPRPRGEQRAAA
jgi:S1-C subfamily serine protease